MSIKATITNREKSTVSDTHWHVCLDCGTTFWIRSASDPHFQKIDCPNKMCQVHYPVKKPHAFNNDWILDRLGSVKDGIENDLDGLLGGKKGVCPHCGQLTNLVHNTGTIAPHVYQPVEQTDFYKGPDFSLIVDCPGSGKQVNVIEG